ncbi:MAG: adenylate/guanylate cyclase domain-containing protein [Solirubrobacteraceae bacterium]|nr:adenylate/guanylate cyclase domain-containing protein [Solirubrobacteraceae bacterium]
MASDAPTTPELLLDVLELTALSAASSRQLVSDLRKRHSGLRRAKERLPTWLETLESEGLVETTTHLGRRAYRCTGAGLQTLEEYGRYPNGGAVLFTDLVGSTALIGTFGEDEAHALRLRHFELLRAPVRKLGGREVKGLGDGLMVVFRDAGPALTCAAAMQRAVASDTDRLGLRVGVHLGPLLREADDFHGTTVIVAARLCDRAESGQILVSSDAWDAVGADAPPGRLVGDLDLKGLGDPVATYELDWSAERSRR